jgi:hypothetical protein
MWVTHYRFTRPFPARLHYANGSIALEIVQMPSAPAHAQWHFRARKLDRTGTTCALHTAPTRAALERDLFEAGFPAERQFIAPQRKIMQRLIAEGYAISANLKLNSKTGQRG